MRRQLHPDGVVTYIIDRNINYTNFCTEYCTFCAFYRPLKGKLAAEGYILDFDTIYAEDRGDGRTRRHRRAHAGRPASRPEDRLAREDAARHQAALPAHPPALLLGVGNHRHRRVQRAHHPRHHRPPARRRARFHPRRRRRDSRRRSPLPHRAPEVPDRRLAQRPSHRAPARHAHHRHHDVRRRRDLRAPHQPLCSALYDLQEETGGFTAFIPWSFQPHNTALGGRGWDEATAVEYLKVLAISRLYPLQLPQRAIELGDAGAEGLPARACASAATTSAR